MSIEWDKLKQHEFDRVVEALVLRRFGEGVRAVDGRGGDDGIDIEIMKGTRRTILQLKCFPEGFSGGFKDTRRRQIQKSFDTAMSKRKPAEWKLVLPSVCTNDQDQFVRKLNKARKDRHYRPRRTRQLACRRSEAGCLLPAHPDQRPHVLRASVQPRDGCAAQRNEDVQKRIAALASVIDTGRSAVFLRFRQ